MMYVVRKLYSAAAAAALIVAMPALAADNLIDNGSFSSGSDATSFTGGAGAAGTSAASNWLVHHNSYATTTTALVASNAPGGGATAIHVITTDGSNGIYQVTPETFTYASASIFVNSGTVRFYAYTNAGNTQAASVALTATGGWQHVTLQIPMAGYGPLDSNELVFYSEAGSAADFLVDNVYAGIAPVPEPGEWAMLVAGGAVAAGAARRRRRAAKA